MWIAYDLPGSYEEMPPNLIDELARDHRWCQGNLMNMRLFLMKRAASGASRRVHDRGHGVRVGAALVPVADPGDRPRRRANALAFRNTSSQPFQLFPLWPEWRPERAITLFSATALLLFLPKILASLLVEANGYGGRLRLALSVLIECALSALLAPVRMLFHAQFVVASLLGRAVRWRSPKRADAHTDWAQAFRRHGVHTVFGIAWIALVWWLDPQYLPWLLPVVGALILSIPLSVYTSRADAGKALRRQGLFLIPEETRTPPVLIATRKYLREAAPAWHYPRVERGLALGGTPRACAASWDWHAHCGRTRLADRRAGRLTRLHGAVSTDSEAPPS